MQVAKISDALRPELIDRYVKHLRQAFGPGLAELDDGVLRPRVEQTVLRAHGLGLRAPLDELRFLNLAASFGWQFDQDTPWVGPMLRDGSIPEPSERLRRVKARFVRQLQLAQHNFQVRQGADSTP
ncbi:MAG: hypothetical protein K0V04_09355 [Deltaproteobacteria bacterium]|nr:hypothetical protein [Deltaproteobacteria bacterium]